MLGWKRITHSKRPCARRTSKISNRWIERNLLLRFTIKMTSFGHRNRSDGNPFKLVKSLSTTFFFNRHKEYSTNLGEKKIALDDTLRDVKCSMKLEESRARKEKERFSKTAHGNRMARLFSPPPAPGRNVGFACVYGNVNAPPTLRSGSRSLIPSASTSQVPSSAQYSPFLSPRHRRMSETNDQNSENKAGEKLGSSGNHSGERQGQLEKAEKTLEKVEKTPEKVATAPENAVEEKSDKDKETENKKIVEMESRQKPLIDHNRKLTERNRTLQTEMRKMEQKYSHSQDDFLTLRDAHERILKENTQLKEKRTSPEKLEELDRYRNQVLEYSKCITALRSSGLEKDRRYEALVQKFKQLKKMAKGEDDKQSVVGSDCSGESSINFDTINEDFEESLNKDIEVINQALYKENAELQKALNDLKSSGLSSESESLLRDQLNYAQSTIAQQQILIETNQEMISQTAQLKATVASQQTKIKQLEQTIEDLESTISSQREKSELLEFQVLESEARRKSEERERPSDGKYDENAPPVEVVKRELNLDEIISLKSELRSLRNAPNLQLIQRQVIGRTEGYIANLEEKLTETTQADEIMKVLKDKLNNVEKNATELEKKSQKSEKQLKELQGKITEKDKQLEDIQKIKKESEERLIEMEKKDKESTEKLKTMEKKLGEIEKVKKQLKEKNDELEKASKQFEAKVAEYENKMKEQQSQLSESTSNPETEKALQQEVETLKNKVSELVAAKEKLDEEMRVISKEMSKLKYNLQNKESELERETKNAEQLNAKLQEIVHSNQEESIKKEQKMSKLKKDSESIKKKLADFEAKNKSMQAEYDNLKAEYEQFKEDQRPSIRTELERRYEETRYRLMCALEKIDRYEKLFEAARKTEGGGNFSQILEQEVVELKEFNAHLERQFQTQSEIIDALKMKIINQKKFNDLVFKLCNLENSSEVEEILSDYAKNRDNEGAKLADCIVFLMKIVRKNHSELMSPLEISTNAHKIRPYNSIDSSNEWMSNSSEGMQSPDEHDGRWEGKAAVNNNHQYARGAAS